MSVTFSGRRLNERLPEDRFASSAPAGAVGVSAAIRPLDGAQMPALPVDNWGGGGIDFADYLGTTLIVDFWSPSDGESRRSLDKIHEAIGLSAKTNVAVIAICVEENRSNYDALVSKHGRDYAFTLAFSRSTDSPTRG